MTRRFRALQTNINGTFKQQLKSTIPTTCGGGY